MPKATPLTAKHVLYLRKFPTDLTRRLKAEAALHGCTVPHVLAQILRKHFKIAD